MSNNCNPSPVVSHDWRVEFVFASLEHEFWYRSTPLRVFSTGVPIFTFVQRHDADMGYTPKVLVTVLSSPKCSTIQHGPSGVKFKRSVEVKGRQVVYVPFRGHLFGRQILTEVRSSV